MTTIGITGAGGLMGWHLRCRARVRNDIEAIPTHRELFSDANALDDFVRQCDAIVHFAGMNRGNETEIERTNPALAQALVDACDRTGATPHILFSSSTHVDRDTAYGHSKRTASEILEAWAKRNGARFTNWVFPHVFGEKGRPFANSVVSTFCYQLAQGENPAIDHDGQLALLHAQEMADLCLEAIDHGRVGEIRPEGKPLRVSEMLARLRSLADSYLAGIVPQLADPFDLRLFNTFRSYLFPDYYPVALTLHSDNRGSLFEGVKSHNGGQAFLSTTKPGVTRGNHFHFQKVERFLVVQGEALIRLRRLFDDQVVEFPVAGEQPTYIDMPTLHTHNITNVGEGELLTLFWSHELFDPQHPDTFREPVELEGGP